MGRDTVQSVTDGTVIIDKDGIAILVSLDLVTKIRQVPSNTELTAGLHSNACQSEPRMQRDGEENNSYVADPNDLEPAEYVIVQIVAHRDTRN